MISHYCNTEKTAENLQATLAASLFVAVISILIEALSEFVRSQ